MKWKAFFINFKELSVAKNCLRPENASLSKSVEPTLIGIKSKNNWEQLYIKRVLLWLFGLCHVHNVIFQPEFHEVLKSPILENEYCENVIDYPHILDWFFYERTQTFIKHWPYNSLGLWKLSEKAAKSRKAKSKLYGGIKFNALCNMELVSSMH